MTPNDLLTWKSTFLASLGTDTEAIWSADPSPFLGAVLRSWHQCHNQHNQPTFPIKVLCKNKTSFFYIENSSILTLQHLFSLWYLFRRSSVGFRNPFLHFQSFACCSIPRIDLSALIFCSWDLVLHEQHSGSNFQDGSATKLQTATIFHHMWGQGPWLINIYIYLCIYYLEFCRVLWVKYPCECRWVCCSQWVSRVISEPSGAGCQRRTPALCRSHRRLRTLYLFLDNDFSFLSL